MVLTLLFPFSFSVLEIDFRLTLEEIIGIGGFGKVSVLSG